MSGHEAKWTGSRDCATVGQAFQADVRLESLTYYTETPAVPVKTVAGPSCLYDLVGERSVSRLRVLALGAQCFLDLLRLDGGRCPWLKDLSV
jgi:hypothetical protein